MWLGGGKWVAQAVVDVGKSGDFQDSATISPALRDPSILGPMRTRKRVFLLLRCARNASNSLYSAMSVSLASRLFSLNGLLDPLGPSIVRRHHESIRLRDLTELE